MKLNEIRPDLNFELYSSPINEADPTLKEKYWDKYWALPDEVLKQHNYFYTEYGIAEMENSELMLAYNSEKNIALLKLHGVVEIPEIKHNGAFCLFIYDRLILLSTLYGGSINCNFKEKTKDEIFELTDLNEFKMNGSFKWNDELSEILLKAFATFALRFPSPTLKRKNMIIHLKNSATTRIITAEI